MPHPFSASFLLTFALVEVSPGPKPQAPPPCAVATVDPYTRGEREPLQRAGYESFGPFPFCMNHDSAAVAALLPEEPIAWIETAHFRLGASLSPLRLDDRNQQPELRAELKALASKLPGVDPKTRDLDPWLRAHLFAQRLERIHAEVSAVLQVDDDAFSKTPSDPIAERTFMGLGPHFGMKEKFTVLLLRDGAHLRRFTAAFHGIATSEPSRQFDHALGCGFVGAAETSVHGTLAKDRAMHANVAYHTAALLYVSYRSYCHDVPAWVIDGLAHDHARAVATDVPIHVSTDLESATAEYTQWDSLWKSRLAEGRFDSSTEWLEGTNQSALTDEQRLQAWAFVRHLRSLGPTAFPTFFRRLKDPFHRRLRFPTLEELAERQRSAWQEAFGATARELFAAWQKQPLRKEKKRTAKTTASLRNR